VGQTGHMRIVVGRDISEHTSSDNDLDLDPGSTRFEFQLGHMLFSLRDFVVY
jgi:hypothetical protein